MKEKLQNIADSIDGFFMTAFLLGFALCAGLTGLYYDYSVSPLKQKVSEYEAWMERFQSVEQLRMVTGGHGATFNYGDYDKHPVQLFVDDHGRVSLQVIYGSGEYPEIGLTGAMEYLRKQVELATISSDGAMMGNGMKLRVNGYPIWGPTTLVANGRSARELFFGDVQTFNNRIVVVRGSETKPIGFYPYTLPVR